jgi:UDP-N-acetylmuramate--alanine ligase
VKTKNGIVYFLGIGGIGMSALARYFKQQGYPVYGYDAAATPLTHRLEEEGMIIHYREDIAQIPDNVERVIYTPAIPETHQELRYFKAQGFRLEKRAEVIGEISRGLFTIAIAGTHGKTSITAMVAHILQTAGLPVLGFVGGIVKNYGTNFVASPHARYMVVEADEYDRSLLTLHPDVAVVTSIDADHLDIYSGLEDLQQTFRQFVRLLPEKGLLVHHYSLKSLPANERHGLSYGLSSTAQLAARHLHIRNGRIAFEIVQSGKRLLSLEMAIPGEYYVENVLAAVGVALAMQVDSKMIKKALESFRGVERRFDYRINRPGQVFVDDYAHHPREIEATLQAARKLYPGTEMTVVFQPHLYSRTRDLADGFARALSLADRLILLDIYPAREKPIPGVTSQLILDKVNTDKKMILSKKELLLFLEKQKPALLLTLGAGDIGMMASEIEQILRMP